MRVEDVEQKKVPRESKNDTAGYTWLELVSLTGLEVSDQQANRQPSMGAS